MNDIVVLIIFAFASYMFGNINWAIIISRSKKQDIRSMGSGNPGTLNMSRNMGLKFGLLTFFLDIMKGIVPTLLAFFIFKGRYFPNSNFEISDFAIYLCGLCVVLGHIYPIVFKFKGGKGIASTIGVFIVCESVYGWSWAVIIIMSLVAAAIFIYLTEFGAMGSFIAITPSAIASSVRLFVVYGTNQASTTANFYMVTNILIFAICLFTWFAHRHNIERMLAGEEHPTSIKEMVVKMKLKKAQERAEREKLAQENDLHIDQKDNK